MSLGTRIALLIGAAVLLATAIAGTGLALSSRSVGRDVIDRELLAAAATFNGPDARPDPALLRTAFDLRAARCDPSPLGARADDGQRGDGERPPPADDNRQGGPRGQNPRNGRFLTPLLRTGLQLIEPDGTTTASCLPPFKPGRSEQKIAATGLGQSLRSVSIDDDRYRVLTVGYGSIGAVQFAEELQVVESAMRGLRTLIVSFGLIGAFLSGLFGWFWARRATRPVRDLSAAAERVALTQDLGERISVSGADEIGTLAASFNKMLVSLDTSRAQQRRLVQDASHELRTPLTSIRTNIDLLQRHPTIDGDTRSTILRDIQAELEELSDLTEELVDSATAIDSNLDERIDIEFEELVEACLVRARRRHDRQIDFAVVESAHVNVEPAAVARAIDNLLGNAAKFTPAGGSISVSVVGGTITVRDTGPGIPDVDLPNVFDRFYRATTARTAPGSGLGLSIVKQVVEAHDGEVFASNDEGGGAVVGFTLPIVLPAS